MLNTTLTRVVLFSKQEALSIFVKRRGQGLGPYGLLRPFVRKMGCVQHFASIDHFVCVIAHTAKV